VVAADGYPYRRRLRVMGMPVKSNFRLGYQGKMIFNPEYFKV